MILRKRWHLGALAATLFSGGLLQAQSGEGPRPGSVEVGAFGQWSSFDENAGRLNSVPEDGIGYGGRLGFFFSDRLELEGDGYYSPQNRDPDENFCCTGTPFTDIDVSAFALRLNYNLPLGNLMGGQSSQFVLGAGAVRTNYSFAGGSDPDRSENAYGGSGLAALRLGLMRGAALRFDAVIDHMPSHGPGGNTNLHGRGGLSFLTGGARRAAMAPAAPMPAPRPLSAAPAAPAPPPPPAAPAERQIQVCVVENGELRNVSASFRPASNDTLVNGRAFAVAYPSNAPAYASSAAWFVQQDTMSFENAAWVKYGLSRTVQPSELRRVGTTNGTTVFAMVGREAPYDVVYVPVRTGCELQPYRPRETLRPRG